MLVLNLPFKALMFLTLMRPSLVLFLVLWLKLVKDFLKVRCRLRSEERFSRNAETDLVCRLLLEKKKKRKFSSLLTYRCDLNHYRRAYLDARSCPAHVLC